CGAEPIQAETMQRFTDAFSACGFKAENMMPCYGMAESTLAITFNNITTPIKVDVIDKQRYRDGHQALPVSDGIGMNVVSCGFPFFGHEIGIVDDDGKRLPDRMVG